MICINILYIISEYNIGAASIVMMMQAKLKLLKNGTDLSS